MPYRARPWGVGLFKRYHTPSFTGWAEDMSDADDDVARIKQHELDIEEWTLRYRERLAARCETPLNTPEGAWLQLYPVPDEIDLEESPEDCADDELSCWSDDGDC